jgi:hypothetical protein
MDVARLREKAALCLRIARELSWNNPARLQLSELAGRYQQRARELEFKTPSTTVGRTERLAVDAT